MLHYLLLLGSAFLFSMQIIFTKMFETKCGKAFYATTCFSFVSSALLLIVLLAISGFHVQFTPFALLMGGLLGAVTVATNLLSIKAMALGKVSVYTLFLMLGGMLVPFIVGVIWLNEPLKWEYVIASVLLLIAMLFPVFDPAETGSNVKKSHILFLILCVAIFMANGGNSVFGKLHQISDSAVGILDFLIIDYMFETGLSLLLFLGCRSKEKYRCAVQKDTIISAFGFGFVHIAATFLQLYCATTISASMMYPFITGGTLVFTPLLTLFLFKEKINRYTVACIGLSVIASILFAF